MLKLRVGILCVLLLGIVTVAAAETGPRTFLPISFRFRTPMES